MNKIVNKFFLDGDKFIPELHLRQPGFTYGNCGPFVNHHRRNQKFKETSDSNYSYKNELDKAYFAHDGAYSDSKDLARRTVSDKILKNRAYKIAISPIYEDIKEDQLVWSIIFLTKKTGSRVSVNEALAQ